MTEWSLASDPEQTTTAARPAGPSGTGGGGRDHYISGLVYVGKSKLMEVAGAIGLREPPPSVTPLALAVSSRLADTRFLAVLVDSLGPAARVAAGLFSMTECTDWPARAWAWSLLILGLDPHKTFAELLGLGIAVIAFDPREAQELEQGRAGIRVGTYPSNGPEFAVLGFPWVAGVRVVAHPSILGVARTVLSDPTLPGSATTAVRQIREPDALESLLRLSVLWQLVDEAPPRRTQNGMLFKRDRQRLQESTPLCALPVDCIEPIAAPADFWLELARSIGLVYDEADGDRVLPARHTFWEENAVHLPRIVALNWLVPRHDTQARSEGGEGAWVRAAILLRLAALAPDAWIAVEDLASELDRSAPAWRGFTTNSGQSRDTDEDNGRPRRKPSKIRERSVGPEFLLPMLLGHAYQLGLVQVAEAVPLGTRVLRISPLGRYVLAVGPTPGPKPPFEQFLYVQPNFEMIAYRQGLTPSLIGELARFANWVRLDTAIALVLTPDSIYRGLGCGMSPGSIEERLDRHSARPVPASVADAIKTWAGRRERVSFHAAATLLEFSSPLDLEAALLLWTDTGKTLPERIGDRLLLVQDESSIPFQGFRQTGSRDYRRPIESCLEVEPDGITLVLDLARSDLLIDAELARVAEPVPTNQGATGAPRRSVRITPKSLAHAFRMGLSLVQLEDWFRLRVGTELSPAIRLLVRAVHRDREHPRKAFKATMQLIVTTASVELLDGLLQHPDTSPYLGERLGPTTVVIPTASQEALAKALHSLGIEIDGLPGPPAQTKS